MKKYIGVLIMTGLISTVASAALVTPFISNGEFEGTGNDWRLYGGGMGLGLGDTVSGTYSINFDATGWTGGDYGFDRWGTMISMGGTDNTIFSFIAKNNNGALGGNRIGLHIVEFNGTQAAPALTAADAVYYFDTGAPGSWANGPFEVPYAIRNPATTMVNIGFKYYNTSDNVSFTLANGNYNIDSVQTIPEPATMGLIAIFGGALFGLRRLRG